MNQKKHKIDKLLQYILVVAGQNDYLNRELGMIHLIKYAYLADLNNAKYHNGEIYTGLQWLFHHFGPWSVECYKRIEPALETINAKKKIIESDKHDDFVRWYADDYDLFERLNNEMDLGVSGTIQKYVRKFGADTYGLLDFVYKTPPMLQAVPEEILDFKHVVKIKKDAEKIVDVVEHSARQKKKRRERIEEYKERLNQKLNERIRANTRSVCPLPPRYDEVFFEGVSQLDEIAEIHAEEGDYVAVFTDDVWKSEGRRDPELS